MCRECILVIFGGVYTYATVREKNEDLEGFYALMTWRCQKKILSDPVSLSARDFFQKRAGEEPLVRRRTLRIEDFGTRYFANYGVRQTLSLHYE
jgi:hypothetical protein